MIFASIDFQKLPEINLLTIGQTNTLASLHNAAQRINNSLLPTSIYALCCMSGHLICSQEVFMEYVLPTLDLKVWPHLIVNLCTNEKYFEGDICLRVSIELLGQIFLSKFYEIRLLLNKKHVEYPIEDKLYFDNVDDTIFQLLHKSAKELLL